MLAAVPLSLVVAIHTTLSIKGIKILKPDPKHAIRSLREKLMRENYDYISEETDRPFLVRAIDKETTNVTDLLKKPNTYNRHKKIQKPHAKYRTNYYVSEVISRGTRYKKTKAENGEQKRKTEDVAKKDLLYYIDDKELYGLRSTTASTASVTYKFLKIIRNFRRNQDTRYIKEEGTNGMAIIKLGAGPFPVLRLPPARRQYMHDHANADDDEQVLPPPALYDHEQELPPTALGSRVGTLSTTTSTS